MTPVIKLFLILSTVVLALTARGDAIVFNTLGPGDTYNPSSAYILGGGETGSVFESAARFTSAATGLLATVDLGVTWDNEASSAAGLVNVFLYSDVGGSPDNANQIFLGSGTPTGIFDDSTNTLLSFTVTSNVSVTAGSVYWLVVKPAVAGEADTWQLSSPPIFGAQDFSIDDSTWVPAGGGFPEPLAAFRITAVSTVPDSGSTVILLLGSVGSPLALRRMIRRERKHG